LPPPERGVSLSENRSEVNVGSLDAGAGFVVDPAGLDVIATTLQGTREDVVAIIAGLRRLPEGSRSALGAAGAHQAYTNFFGSWIGELETAAGGLAELTDRMRATAMTYHNADQTEQRRFGSDPLPNATPSPEPGAAEPLPMGAVGRALERPSPRDGH
jgi:hypothetical protein